MITFKDNGKISRLVCWSLLVILIVCVSCEAFLDMEPPDSVIRRDDVFKDAVTADLAILGIYASLNEDQSFVGGGISSVSSMCGLSADELVNVPRIAPDLLEFEQNILSASNGTVLTLWSSAYKSIYIANSAMESLNKSTTIEPNVKEQLLGECYFMRALCHFHLVNLFGDVPVITSTDYKVNAVVKRSSKSVVYDQIIEDLQTAKDLLPATLIGNAKTRVNAVAATALLARVYLYLERWSEAEAEATAVIDDTQYDLIPLAQVFLANSAEAIWQLRPGQVISENGSTKEAFVFLPPGVMLNNVLKTALVNQFDTEDLRLTEWIRKFGTVYYPYKYRQGSYDAPMTEYSMVLRLAEQYLIRAEARAHNGNINGLNSAQSDLNEIRERAGLPDVGDLSFDDMLRAIENERLKELFTEQGHRWFDLKRTNRADAVLGPIKTRWSSIDALYPIPQLERQNNPNLNPQNPGY